MNLENYFISQFKNAHIGDDGALVGSTVYSKDAFFENVHFKKEWMSYYQIAAKAMTVNISDAIAMNAKPKYALLSVAMPKSMTMKEMRELASGFEDTAAKYGIEIIGGDTIGNIKLDITITIISEADKPLRRQGLRKGYLVAHTGELGRSAKELRRLSNLGKIHKNSKFVDIRLRDKFVSKASRYLKCGMDISDGLFSDLKKLSSANRLGFDFYKRIPKRVGCSGEEYEMLFGFDKRDKKALLRVAKVCRTPITIVAQSARKITKTDAKRIIFKLHRIIMNRFYSLSHSSIDFHFRQTPRDFVVEEMPLYEFSGEGEHLVLFVRKKSLSTLELVSIIAKYLGIQNKEIGYAGLKDKHAMTKQYISLHKKHEAKMDAFEHDDIKILSKAYHNNKIRIGHLSGNRFYIKLKKVNPTAAKKIDEALKNIATFGMPNFFGYQRFGTDGNNHIDGEKIAKGEKKERNVKVKKLLISAYQSHLFNLWLSRRLEINALVQKFETKDLEPLLNMPNHELEKMKAQTHPFKLISGDIMEHYPHGRLFDYEGSEHDLERFNEKDISVTGLLCGKKARIASDAARVIEKEFDDEINADGTRRYAWVYPEGVEGRYKDEEAQYELNFSLPKGSYATVLIEEIAKREIRE